MSGEGKMTAVWVGDHWSLLTKSTEKPKHRYGQKIAYTKDGVSHTGTIAKIYRINYVPGLYKMIPASNYYIVTPSCGGHSHWVPESEVK